MILRKRASIGAAISRRNHAAQLAMFKKILKSGAFRSVMCRLVAFYISFVHRTGRWRHVDGANLAGALENGPVILAFWHGRLLMVPPAWARRASLKVMISQHRDGDLIANSVAPLGVGAIRGSSSKPGKDKSKGGAAALKAMVRELKSGGCVGITPDGPRGPRMHASDGIVKLARLSEAPIVPFAFASTRGRLIRSWDRFFLALPFSKGYFVWGAPIRVDRGANPEEIAAGRSKIEAALNEATERADRLAGRTPVAPASSASVARTAGKTA